MFLCSFFTSNLAAHAISSIVSNNSHILLMNERIGEAPFLFLYWHFAMLSRHSRLCIVELCAATNCHSFLIVNSSRFFLKTDRLRIEADSVDDEKKSTESDGV